MTRRHWVLAILFLAAASIAVFGDRTPNADIAPALAREQPKSLASPVALAAVGQLVTGKVPAPLPSATLLAVLPRESLIGRDTGEPHANLFAAHSFAPVQVASAAPIQEAPRELPFKYLGKQDSGKGWTVFLEKNDTTFIVKASDAVGDDYKVVSITASAITFEYLPTHEQSSLQIE
ncbi:hypothetical protein [Collimonas silvisoli]|uniref:hypothetical protein n=1 Tax=Collimonas silvisoli TaxID=2825884 RepID=UPI001B8B3B9A|nr:hypothetical protein [Collimonas silvisoli]